MESEALKKLLEAIAIGDVTPEVALEKFKNFDFEKVEEFAKIDHHRNIRTGFPEVIWGPGKKPEQIVKIMEVMRQHNPVVMATRIEPEIYEQLQDKISNLYYYRDAKTAIRKKSFIEIIFADDLNVFKTFSEFCSRSNIRR